MPALNFLTRFADDVESGRKRQTIRAQRKHPLYIGDALYLFTGMRTKGCRRLGDHTCTMVQEIRIKPNGTVRLDGQAICRTSAERIAKADGFESLKQFVEFFCADEREFNGQLIQW